MSSSLARSDWPRLVVAPRTDHRIGYPLLRRRVIRQPRRTNYREENLPAQSAPSSQEARIPCPYEHPGRPRRPESAPRQGPRSTLRLIHRIRTRAEFERLGRSGRRVRNDLFWCSHLPDPLICPPRVAFAIGRAHGPAVMRNRIRRRIRPILTELSNDQRLSPGHYLVGINRSKNDQAFATTADQLRESLTDLMSRLPAER